jgi:hypothetical protein
MDHTQKGWYYNKTIGPVLPTGINCIANGQFKKQQLYNDIGGIDITRREK